MTTPNTTANSIWIRSTTDPETRKAACILTWGPIEALLQPDIVLATARDLVAAAAAVRSRRASPAAKVALRIGAVAGAKTGKPYVHIGRGSMKGELSPDEAREMALNWTQAAVAAEIDARLRYVLGDLGHLLTPVDVEEIFAKLQSLQR